MTKVHLPPFSALRAFEAVGRLNGIRRAADALGVSHAIVSRHVSALEQHLGVALLHRKTGELTVAGREYHTRVSQAIYELEAATRAVAGAHRNRLTIWCSAGFALHWLARRLHEFSPGRNGLLVDLRSTDSEPDFEQGEVDGDIRYALDAGDGAARPGVRLLELARPQVFPVASPDFLDKHRARIRAPEDLCTLPLIEEGSDLEWRAWLSAQSIETAELPVVARYGQAHLALAAARAGQGVALTNSYLAAEDLAHGRLARVTASTKEWSSVALGAYVFRSARSRWTDPALVKLRSWLQQTLANEAPGAT